MMQGINLESLDPIKGKNKLGKEQEQKPKELDFTEEPFKKVFSKMLDKQEGVQEDLGVFNESKLAPSGYKPNKLSEHIQLSAHPGKFAMMQNIDPENYKEGLTAFKQITAAEFDPDKLPKPEVSQLGMRSLVTEIGLGVVG
ncbi:MAG: hypothetical protein PHF25_02415 [Candidatus Margulisbacteria bacterium]|nr:hypothetical protein [Candidatus Margulisiibacteriota bacterium]